MSQAKKWATQVAQNALRACNPKELALLALVRVLPDENTDACAEHHTQTNDQNSGKYDFIEKHGEPPATVAP